MKCFGRTRALPPIDDLDVTAHEPVLSSNNNAFDLLAQTEAIRAMEGGGGQYMGMMSISITGAVGVAFQPGRTSFAVPFSAAIVHELGHNLSLSQAPCEGAGGQTRRSPT